MGGGGGMRHRFAHVAKNGITARLSHPILLREKAIVNCCDTLQRLRSACLWISASFPANWWTSWRVSNRMCLQMPQHLSVWPPRRGEGWSCVLSAKTNRGWGSHTTAWPLRRTRLAHAERAKCTTRNLAKGTAFFSKIKCSGLFDTIRAHFACQMHKYSSALSYTTLSAENGRWQVTVTPRCTNDAVSSVFHLSLCQMLCKCSRTDSESRESLHFIWTSITLHYIYQYLRSQRPVWPSHDHTFT